MPRHVTRRKKAVENCAKARERDRPSAVNLTIGHLLAGEIVGAVVERVAARRQDQLGNLFPLLRKHRAVGLKLRELTQTFVYDTLLIGTAHRI